MSLAKIRKLLPPLQREIEQKRTRIEGLRVRSPKQLGEAQEILGRVLYLERVYDAINRVAEQFDAMTLPAHLYHIQSREDIERHLDDLVSPRNPSGSDLLRLLEWELVNHRPYGYWPTPVWLVDEMISLMGDRPARVLDSSAGKGDILLRVRHHHPHIQLVAAEWDAHLGKILQLRGIPVIASDALTVHEKFDHVLINPPFEKGRDIEHIRHAYTHNVGEGGRVIAICGDMAFSDPDFRQWVKDHGFSRQYEQVEFEESGRKTKLNIRLVCIGQGHTPVDPAPPVVTYDPIPEPLPEPEVLMRKIILSMRQQMAIMEQMAVELGVDLNAL